MDINGIVNQFSNEDGFSIVTKPPMNYDNAVKMVKSFTRFGFICETGGQRNNVKIYTADETTHGFRKWIDFQKTFSDRGDNNPKYAPLRDTEYSSLMLNRQFIWDILEEKGFRMMWSFNNKEGEHTDIELPHLGRFIRIYENDDSIHKMIAELQDIKSFVLKNFDTIPLDDNDLKRLEDSFREASDDYLTDEEHIKSDEIVDMIRKHKSDSFDSFLKALMKEDNSDSDYTKIAAALRCSKFYETWQSMYNKVNDTRNEQISKYLCVETPPKPLHMPDPSLRGTVAHLDAAIGSLHRRLEKNAEIRESIEQWNDNKYNSGRIFSPLKMYELDPRAEYRCEDPSMCLYLNETELKSFESLSYVVQHKIVEKSEQKPGMVISDKTSLVPEMMSLRDNSELYQYLVKNYASIVNDIIMPILCLVTVSKSALYHFASTETEWDESEKIICIGTPQGQETLLNELYTLAMRDHYSGERFSLTRDIVCK